MATTCLVLASKFDEIDDNIPLVADFAKLLTNAFAGVSKKYKLAKRAVSLRSKEIFGCEPYVLGLLEWDLNCSTFYSYIQNYVFQGFMFSTDELPYRGRTMKLE